MYSFETTPSKMAKRRTGTMRCGRSTAASSTILGFMLWAHYFKSVLFRPEYYVYKYAETMSLITDIMQVGSLLDQVTDDRVVPFCPKSIDWLGIMCLPSDATDITKHGVGSTHIYYITEEIFTLLEDVAFEPLNGACINKLAEIFDFRAWTGEKIMPIGSYDYSCAKLLKDVVNHYKSLVDYDRFKSASSLDKLRKVRDTLTKIGLLKPEGAGIYGGVPTSGVETVEVSFTLAGDKTVIPGFMVMTTDNKAGYFTTSELQAKKMANWDRLAILDEFGNYDRPATCFVEANFINGLRYYPYTITI